MGLKKFSLGTLGNSIAGILGGGIGAQILGPLLGGMLIDAMGYRSIFPAAAMLMIVGLAILQFVRPRARSG